MKPVRGRGYSDVRDNQPSQVQRIGEQLMVLLWSLVKLGILVVIVGALYWGGQTLMRQISQDESMRLQELIVQPKLQFGDASELEQRVLHHLKEKQSFNMIEIDVQQLAQDLREIAWLHQVQVRKHSLRQLLIEVEERVPVFRFGADEWIDAAGVRFKVPTTDALKQLFQIDAPIGYELMAFKYAEVMKPWLDEQGIEVSALVMDSQRRFYLILKEGVKISLGARELNQRLKNFSYLYHRQLKALLPLLDEVNMAHPTGAVLSFKKGIKPQVDSKNKESAAKP